MYEKSNRGQVAWDIETTGFGWSAEITVSGFWYPDGHATLILNAGPHDADGTMLENHLTDTCGGSVRLVVADDESALLDAMQAEIFERFDRDYDRLIAYNGDSWKGGFDLPFVRTRCIRQGVDWPFDGIAFADLWEPVKKRLNTTHTAYGATDDANSLTGAHALLFTDGDGLSEVVDDYTHPPYASSEYDPFEDSGSAAARYREGNLLPVCLHNLADVHRTWELGELVRQFVPARDVTEKKL